MVSGSVAIRTFLLSAWDTWASKTDSVWPDPSAFAFAIFRIFASRILAVYRPWDSFVDTRLTSNDDHMNG